MGREKNRETRGESRPAMVLMMRRAVLRKMLYHAATRVTCIGWRAPKVSSSLLFPSLVSFISLVPSRRFHLVGFISLVFRCGIARTRSPPPSLCFLSPSFFLFVVLVHVLYRIHSFFAFYKTPPRVIFFGGVALPAKAGGLRKKINILKEK